MSELTNVARPYAKAAFDFAVEQNALAAWADMRQGDARAFAPKCLAQLQHVLDAIAPSIGINDKLNAHGHFNAPALLKYLPQRQIAYRLVRP